MLALINLVAAVSLQAAGATQPAAEPLPLFASEEPVTIVLRAPFKTLLNNRRLDAPSQPAELTYSVADGEPVTMQLKVELRGITRRRKNVCNFPPIRLDFPKDSVTGTLFAGQNRLKLVTHCQDKRDQYEQYVLLEYLIYKSLNTLTDMSFQVRLATMTYEDTEGDRDPLTKVAFIIEDDDAVAERFGYEVLEIPGVTPDFMEPSHLALISLFQYMIGNTDFSSFTAARGDTVCCHNGKLIGTMAGPVMTVPYDFDYAGLIDARYAEVAEQLPIRDVRQRLYRGVCQDEIQLREAVNGFHANRETIYALFQNQPGLEEKTIERTVRYLDEFYEIISDDRKLNREIVRDCRGM